MTGVMPTPSGSLGSVSDVKGEEDGGMEVDELESITSEHEQARDVNNKIPSPVQQEPERIPFDSEVSPECELGTQVESKPEPKVALALEEMERNEDMDTGLAASTPVPRDAEDGPVIDTAVVPPTKVQIESKPDISTPPELDVPEPERLDGGNRISSLVEDFGFEAVDAIDAEVVPDIRSEDEVKPFVDEVPPAQDDVVAVKEEIPLEEEADGPINDAPTDMMDAGPVDENVLNGPGNRVADEKRDATGTVNIINDEPPTPTSLPEAGPSTSPPTTTANRKTRTPSQKKSKAKSTTQTKSATKNKSQGKGKGKGQKSKDPIIIDSSPEPEFDHNQEDLLDDSPPEVATLHPHGYQPEETTINNHYLYVFFRFCAERHRMTVKREDEGVPRDALTEDECMYKERVGNVFRELDPGSKRIKEVIMGVGDQSYEEICFRVLLNAGFYVPETFQALQDGLGEVPNWKNFNLDKYEEILYERSVIQKKVIYTSAFQLVPPTVYFGRDLPHFAATLRFVKALMESGLPEKLRNCKYAVDASHILQTLPSLGGFLAQNILVSMNDSPEFRFHYRNFATCGPGSRAYLQRIFGKQRINNIAMEQAGLRWLYENQWRYWARLGEDPPHAWKLEKGMRPGMRVLDFENALCWAHRYVNAYQRKGFGSFADIPAPDYDPALTETASMPAWCDDIHQINSPNRASFMGDYEEESQKQAEEEEGEGVYEIEKIICRKGHRDDKNGLFRVRWKGYPPEDDTWEKATTLEEGAEEVLQEWLEWEKCVWETIARITRENPYTRPFPGVKGELKEEADVKPDTTTTRGGKRGRQSTGTAGPSQSRSKRLRGEAVKVEE